MQTNHRFPQLPGRSRCGWNWRCVSLLTTIATCSIEAWSIGGSESHSAASDATCQQQTNMVAPLHAALTRTSARTRGASGGGPNLQEALGARSLQCAIFIRIGCRKHRIAAARLATPATPCSPTILNHEKIHTISHPNTISRPRTCVHTHRDIARERERQ